MHEDLGIGKRFGDLSMVGHVIEMAMSKPEANEVVVSAFGLLKKRPDGVIGSIKENRLAGFIVGNEVAVGGGETAVLG